MGVSKGRCIDYYTNQFVSLGFVAEEYAVEGTQVEVLWGEPGGSQYRVKAVVTSMPLYNGEWRNETCDVMAMIPERPYLAKQTLETGTQARNPCPTCVIYRTCIAMYLSPRLFDLPQEEAG